MACAGIILSAISAVSGILHVSRSTIFSAVCFVAARLPVQLLSQNCARLFSPGSPARARMPATAFRTSATGQQGGHKDVPKYVSLRLAQQPRANALVHTLHDHSFAPRVLESRPHHRLRDGP